MVETRAREEVVVETRAREEVVVETRARKRRWWLRQGQERGGGG